MKMLMLASVASMIDQFNIPNIKMLLDMGYQVDVACNFVIGNTCSKEKIDALKDSLDRLDVKCFQIDFSRNITKVGENITAYKQVKALMKENRYDFVHCHSPIGGLIARLAGKATETKVVYTAHGFHFYKGAPLKNWLIYYPIEWLCAHWTDTLITINQEDYALAQKKMHAKKVVYVPGIGIDLKKFGCSVTTPLEKRKEVGIPDDMTWMLSVGELIKRKNHETMIRAIADFPNVYLTIAGRGELQEYLNTLIKELNLESRVKLLGFRTDISELCRAADVFCMPSFQEGLPVALMEAMACGKPCVVSNIRGNTDLIDEENALFDPHSVDSAKKAIGWILKSDMEQIGRHNAEIIRDFDIEVVLDDMKSIYDENLRGGVHIN